MGTRRSLYFSDVYDKDLDNYIKVLERSDKFNKVAKDLMKDGIKYREDKKVLQSNTPKGSKGVYKIDLR